MKFTILSTTHLKWSDIVNIKTGCVSLLRKALPKSEVVGERRCVPCLLRFDRSCLIVGQHHLTGDFLPANAVFGSPYAL